VEIVSVEQAAAFVAALPDKRDHALWTTAFYAGLRRGELMALRWRDASTSTAPRPRQSTRERELQLR
jgi:integrase